MPRYSKADKLHIPTLNTALQGETVDTLKKLATLVGSKKQQPTRKAELIDFIERNLEGDKLKAHWQQLDDTQKAAVAETVHGYDSLFNADQFVAKYGKNPNWGERDSYGYSLKKPSLLSLFFFGGVMPDDLRRRFQQFVPEPEPVNLNSHQEIPDTVTQTSHWWDFDTRHRHEETTEVPIIRRPTERESCHDLKAVLRLIDTGKVAVSDKTLQPSAATTRTINEVLLGGDYYDDSEYPDDEKIGPIKPFAWPLLVQAGGLTKLSGKRLELTANGQKALNAPPEKTLANLWKRWLKTTILDELRRIDCIKGQTGKGKRGLTAVAGRRAAINVALQDCPSGQWVSVDEFFRQMVIQDNTFEITRDPWRLYIAESHYGSLGYQGFHDWKILQVRYGLCLLFEYAATLGLIDVAYIPPHGARPDYGDLWGTDDLPFFSRYDGLLYLRLNPLGAYSLGMAENYTPSLPETRTELQVLPNLEIVTSGGILEPADELLLNTYTRKLSDAVWQLDQPRLLEAVEAGQDVATLRAFLESRSGKPLPETVIRFLEDMGSRAERLQDKGPARLIECADAAMAALIANDTRTKPHCLLAAERYLVVPAEAETKFRTALRKLGYSLPPMNDYVADNPLIVQSDQSILLEVHSPRGEAAREAIAPFAELIKSPEHIHTYRMTPLSIWNARAAGLSTVDMLAALHRYAKYPVPEGVAQSIETLGRRYGLTVIERDEVGLVLRVADEPLAELILRERKVAPLLEERLSQLRFRLQLGVRGLVKQALVNLGYPAEDLAGYAEGQALPLALRDRTRAGEPFSLRPYQKAAADAFYQTGRAQGGSGVVVLPCGAGKTMVGMAVMAQLQENTLILTTSQTSMVQWRRELLDKTDLPEDAIAEYSSQHKETGPVTLATYQMLTYRPSREAAFVHFDLFHARGWGLIVYDEVHLLPAPVFRVTAELQSHRRLGLTATLIREDGLEGDVFALIGPKRYDVPWRELETQGFIAAAACAELRVTQTAEREMEYALAPRRQQFRLAAENPRKLETVQALLQRETEHHILIIGEFLSQLRELAEITGFPLLTGKTPQKERERLYGAFREGTIPGLVLSRVGNFAVDLPDADVLIQVSGKYGSRQEEAQRLGRVLRPKSDGRQARFYTLVTSRTCEEDFARHRQLFLTEQGYSYRIEDET